MRSFFVTTVILALTASAAMASDCPKCDAYNNAIAQGKQPTDISLVCFYIEQDASNAVPLFLHDASGALLNADPSNSQLPKKEHDKMKKASDSYCIGEHYVEAVIAAGGWVDLCNGQRTSAKIEVPVLKQIVALGNAKQTLTATVCLMDGSACDKRVSDRKVPE